MSNFKFMHTLSESKSIFAIEQKTIVSCSVKNVAFLLGHPIVLLQDPKLYSDTILFVHIDARALQGLYPYIECLFNLQLLFWEGYGSDHFMLERTKFNRFGLRWLKGKKHLTKWSLVFKRA